MKDEEKRDNVKKFYILLAAEIQDSRCRSDDDDGDDGDDEDDDDDDDSDDADSSSQLTK